MNLDQAKAMYLGKVCDVSWSPLDRPIRDHKGKTETLACNTTNVLITHVYENCHGVILFETNDKLYTPFDIKRLINVRDK